MNWTTVSVSPLLVAMLAAPISKACASESSSEAQARAIFEQVFSANRAVKTLEFSFEVTEQQFVNYGDQRPPVTTRWDGSLRAAPPDRFRIEYRADDGDTMIAGVDADGKYRALKWFSKHHVHEGVIAAVKGAELQQGPAVSTFTKNLWLTGLERADLRNWTLKAVAGRYVLGGTIPPSRARISLTVDPARGFVIVHEETSVPAPDGERTSVTDLDYDELQPGIWVSTGGSCVQTIDRKTVVAKWTFRAVPGTVRVNSTLDQAALRVEFPDGTRVSDQIANRSYYVGGDARDGQTVEQLAAKVEAITTPLSGTPVPAAGALSARPTFWQRWSWALIPAAFAAIAAALMIYRRTKTGRQ